LKVYNPSNCLVNKAKNIKSYADAFNSKSLSLGSIQRQYGEKYTANFVTIWLIYLNEITNLKNPMSEEQIKLCSQMILNEFYSLKIADLTFLFSKIISGQYGEFYERLSIDKILSYFRKYFDERCNQAEEQNHLEHIKNKQWP